MIKNKDVIDLMVDANSINNALDGLSSFIFHNVSSLNVKLEDINALNGMVQAIRALASNHAQELTEFESNNQSSEVM